MYPKVLTKFQPDETDRRQAKFLNSVVKFHVEKYFAKYPSLCSATLLVAQFWSDEAHDAVHGHIVFSKANDPDIAAWTAFMKKDETQNSDDFLFYHCLAEGRRSLSIPPMNTQTFDAEILDEMLYIDGWDSNGEAISLFAAYCEEGADQWLFPHFHQPIAIFRRDQDVEVYGDLIRPWLYGVMPEWEAT